MLKCGYCNDTGQISILTPMGSTTKPCAECKKTSLTTTTTTILEKKPDVEHKLKPSKKSTKANNNKANV